MWKEFYEMISEKLRLAEKELAKKGVTKLNLKNFETMIMNKFLEWGRKDFEKDRVSNDILVYGETMGFLLKEGEKKWKVFEGSDEPEKLDNELYRKLIIGEKGKIEKITLYGTHGTDFVRSWEKNGIPENVYFSDELWIAQNYWHPEGDDILVKVKLPEDAVIETSENEFKTIRHIEPSEFELF
jgi:hypothetical protein